MMKTNTFLLGSAAVIAAFGCASAASAQTKAPAARPAAAPASTAAQQAPISLTANVPGVCILQREALLAGSTVGKYVQTRLGQLQSQVQAELNGEGTTLQNDAKSLEAKKATLAPAAYQQQGAALQQRAEALQAKANQRDQELEATRQKALQRVWTEAVPLITDVVKAKNCAVVFDGNAIMVANTEMDVTPGVMAALNGKVQQFTFERERLDAQPQQR
jgi:Skp family chaperone for outer membrane proteins